MVIDTIERISAVVGAVSTIAGAAGAVIAALEKPWARRIRNYLKEIRLWKRIVAAVSFAIIFIAALLSYFYAWRILGYFTIQVRKQVTEIFISGGPYYTMANNEPEKFRAKYRARAGKDSYTISYSISDGPFGTEGIPIQSHKDKVTIP